MIGVAPTSLLSYHKKKPPKNSRSHSFSKKRFKNRPGSDRRGPSAAQRVASHVISGRWLIHFGAGPRGAAIAGPAR